MATVNRKADEIREQLYQRSQDSIVKKQQIEGYSAMHIYKKALGIGAKSGSDEGELKHLDNIDVIDQSQENVKVEEHTTDVKEEQDIDLASKGGLDISVDDYEEDQEMLSPPKIETRLNSDIPTTANEVESPKSEVNEKLTEEITDRILAQILQEELSEQDLK